MDFRFSSVTRSFDIGKQITRKILKECFTLKKKNLKCSIATALSNVENFNKTKEKWVPRRSRMHPIPCVPDKFTLNTDRTQKTGIVTERYVILFIKLFLWSC